MDRADAAAFERCIAAGGLALFPSDTVYGLAVDPLSEPAVERLHELKGRSAGMPAAVMFFALDAALAALPRLGERTAAALRELLPGPLTVVLPNPDGLYPLACGGDLSKVGVRVPALTGALEPLAGVATVVMQSSANLHGGPDPRRLADVDPVVRAGVDLELDGGTLPGVASTVVDLSGYEADGCCEVLREGAVPAAEVGRRLARARSDT